MILRFTKCSFILTFDGPNKSPLTNGQLSTPQYATSNDRKGEPLSPQQVLQQIGIVVIMPTCYDASSVRGKYRSGGLNWNNYDECSVLIIDCCVWLG